MQQENLKIRDSTLGSNRSIAGFKFAYDVGRWQHTSREEKFCG